MNPSRTRHLEKHRSERTGWLRAAVLGSNDAIVSTASLMLGVAASHASREAILVAGIAGLVAGSMSMAAGEYVSVSSQRDAESADIEKEKRELAKSPASELNELTEIYMGRGLHRDLALQVAQQLTAHDELATHLRDELGIREGDLAQPWHAAWVSAVSFAVFALLPLLFLWIAPPSLQVFSIAASSLVSLAILGGLGAKLGGAPMQRAVFRVVLGGGLAMLVTAGIGKLLNVAVG